MRWTGKMRGLARKSMWSGSVIYIRVSYIFTGCGTTVGWRYWSIVGAGRTKAEGRVTVVGLKSIDVVSLFRVLSRQTDSVSEHAKWRERDGEWIKLTVQVAICAHSFHSSDHSCYSSRIVRSPSSVGRFDESSRWVPAIFSIFPSKIFRVRIKRRQTNMGKHSILLFKHIQSSPIRRGWRHWGRWRL